LFYCMLNKKMFEPLIELIDIILPIFYLEKINEIFYCKIAEK